jgi:hypothetical protein
MEIIQMKIRTFGIYHQLDRAHAAIGPHRNLDGDL